MIPSIPFFGAYRRRVVTLLGRRQTRFVSQAQDRRFRLDRKPSSQCCIDLQQVDRDGFKNAFITLEVGEIEDADPIGNEPIYLGDELVGRATGGGYGWRLGKSLALGFVRPDLAEEGNEFEIDILGKLHPAKIIEESPYDPDNEKLRA